MPEDDNTLSVDEPEADDNQDPLGIIGWTIGGKYKIETYLGGGGFGEVYSGYNENLPEQRLVLKFFKRVQAREKFAKEAKILCMLDHPNICRVIDYLPDEGAVVVAFIDGDDGGAILKESGPLPEQLFLKLARAITSAIAYAHEKKIAHRDIKPGNIIVDKRENVYLIDFGIAKEMGTEATKTAYTALTPMFAAPERQTGQKDYNPFLSDIYETGVTLFNLATNSLPYRNPTNPDINEWGGVAARRLSPELTRILRKATHPEPKKRFRTAAEMAEEFKNLQTAFGRARKRPMPLIAAVVIVVLIAAAYLGRGHISEYWARLFPPGQTTAQSDETELQPAERDTTVPERPETTTPPPAETGRDDAGTGEKRPEQSTPTGRPTASQSQQPTTESTARETPSSTGADTTEAELAAIETPQPPPPPPMSHVLIDVSPLADAGLTVDGKNRQPNSRFDISPGRYAVVVVHPDFPVFRKTFTFAEGSADFGVDLAREFATIDTLEVDVALIRPPEKSEDFVLEIIRNGRKQTLFNFPYLGLAQMTGEWNVNLKLTPVGTSTGQQVAIDSFAIFPFDAQRRYVVRGNSGLLKVQPVSPDYESRPRLFIYWKQL